MMGQPEQQSDRHDTFVIRDRHRTLLPVRVEEEKPDYDLGAGTATGKMLLTAMIARESRDGLALDEDKRNLLIGHEGNACRYMPDSTLGRLDAMLEHHFGVAPEISLVAESPERGEVTFRISLAIPDRKTVANFGAAVKQGLEWMAHHPDGPHGGHRR